MSLRATHFGRRIALTAVCAGLLFVGRSFGGGSSSAARPTADHLLLYGPGVANHPVDVVPSDSIRIPPAWPLDFRGAITCLTCHSNIAFKPDGGSKHLREFDPQDDDTTAFCAKCHSNAGKTGGRGVHWTALAKAHLLPDKASRRGEQRMLDPTTRRCLSCHDGASATESVNRTPWTRGHGFSGDERRDHPVGMRYDAITRAKNLSPLRPLNSLPATIALPDGRVACASCHNLYAQEPHLLTVPIEGSQLCFTCHAMR